VTWKVQFIKIWKLRFLTICGDTCDEPNLKKIREGQVHKCWKFGSLDMEWPILFSGCLCWIWLMFMISNFRRVLNVVFFLLGDSPAYEFYVPTFRNTLFHLHRRCKQPTAYEDGTVCFETSAHKIQTPGNHPKERLQYNWCVCCKCTFPC